jgi:hypothetical protein
MKTLYTLIAGLIISFSIDAQTDWHITGNAGTSASTNFIGTTDKVALKMRTNNSVRMTIDPSGNVGIGIVKPKSRLDVAGGITAYSSYFTRQDGAPGVSVGRSGANYGSVGYGLTFTDTTDLYRYNISDFSSMLSFRSGGFDFNTAPSGTAGSNIIYSPVMRIQENGRVGIGTTTPDCKLSVTASFKLDLPVVFIRNTYGAFDSDGMFISAGSNTNTGAFLIRFERPDRTAIGQIEQTATNGVTYFTTSDKRLKNILGTTQKGLSDLMKINIYDYTFNADPNKKVLTGFMAQELFDIFPQSVGKPRDNNEPAEKNPWMVDYGSVTPLIIKSVQEQQQVIDELKKENAEEINKLQQQIDELKALLISHNNEKVIAAKHN